MRLPGDLRGHQHVREGALFEDIRFVLFSILFEKYSSAVYIMEELSASVKPCRNIIFTKSGNGRVELS